MSSSDDEGEDAEQAPSRRRIPSAKRKRGSEKLGWEKPKCGAGGGGGGGGGSSSSRRTPRVSTYPMFVPEFVDVGGAAAAAAAAAVPVTAAELIADFTQDPGHKCPLCYECFLMDGGAMESAAQAELRELVTQHLEANAPPDYVLELIVKFHETRIRAPLVAAGHACEPWTRAWVETHLARHCTNMPFQRARHVQILQAAANRVLGTMFTRSETGAETLNDKAVRALIDLNKRIYELEKLDLSQFKFGAGVRR